MEAKFWLCRSCSEWNSDADNECLRCGKLGDKDVGNKVKCQCGVELRAAGGLGVKCAGCRGVVNVPVVGDMDPVWEEGGEGPEDVFLMLTGATPVGRDVIMSHFGKTLAGKIIISTLLHAGKTEVTMAEWCSWVRTHPAGPDLTRWLQTTLSGTPTPTPSGPVSTLHPSIVIVSRDPTHPLGLHLDEANMKIVDIASDSPSAAAGLDKYVGYKLTHAAGRSVFSPDNVIDAAKGCSSVLLRLVDVP